MHRRIRLEPTALVRLQVIAALTAGAMAGCTGNLVTGPVADTEIPFGSTEGAQVQPRSVETARASEPPGEAPNRAPNLAELARANADNPRDPIVTRAYVRALKANGKRPEALAVLDTAAELEPGNYALKAEQGLLALELGQTAKAQSALQQAAESPTKDWRVLSGLGIAASSQGKQKEAQRHFAKALELSPNNPTVLNNMAMSLILERKIDKAEALLRRAAKGPAPQPQVSQNLALAQALKTEVDTDLADPSQIETTSTTRPMSLGGPGKP